MKLTTDSTAPPDVFADVRAELERRRADDWPVADDADMSFQDWLVRVRNSLDLNTDDDRARWVRVAAAAVAAVEAFDRAAERVTPEAP